MIKQNSRRFAKRQMTWFRHQIEGHFCQDAGALTVALAKVLLEGQKGD